MAIWRYNPPFVANPKRNMSKKPLILRDVLYVSVFTFKVVIASGSDTDSGTAFGLQEHLHHVHEKMCHL